MNSNDNETFNFIALTVIIQFSFFMCTCSQWHFLCDLLNCSREFNEFLMIHDY